MNQYLYGIYEKKKFSGEYNFLKQKVTTTAIIVETLALGLSLKVE